MRYKGQRACAAPRALHGFTLIELLVAITILAIVAVLGWRGLDSIARARAALSADLERTRGTQISFAQLENDAAHLAGQNVLPYHATLQAMPQRLVMIRTLLEEGAPPMLQVVAYKLENGKLSRRESAGTRDLYTLDSIWQSAVSDIDNLRSVELQSGVDSFDLRTWTYEESAWRVAGSDIAASGNAGTSSNTSAPKRGLEVSLQLHGQSGPLLKIFLLGAI